MAVMRSSYVLCSAPRSGTTLLCDMLARTGVAGQPDSFFREKSLADWCRDWPVAGPIDVTDVAFTARYFEAMRRHGRGQTPHFGLRLMGPDLSFACAWLQRLYPDVQGQRALFEAAFGPLHFIHLSRTDKLAEAVSYVRAEQSGLWHQRPDGTALEQIASTAQPGYNAQAITERLHALQALDADWHIWFRQEQITPLRLRYEDLAADPPATLAKVLDFIGQDGALAADITPGVRKLADAQSVAWIARYRREERNG